MARNWTPAQRSAIDERSRTLLVSAAAGSGKTAVLTERIISSLTDPENPTDISRLLVVTFTRAAAQEMRTRIARALGDAIALYPNHTGLRRQLMLLGSAKICTICTKDRSGNREFGHGKRSGRSRSRYYHVR